MYAGNTDQMFIVDRRNLLLLCVQTEQQFPSMLVHRNALCFDITPFMCERWRDETKIKKNQKRTWPLLTHTHTDNTPAEHSTNTHSPAEQISKLNELTFEQSVVYFFYFIFLSIDCCFPLFFPPLISHHFRFSHAFIFAQSLSHRGCIISLHFN